MKKVIVSILAFLFLFVAGYAIKYYVEQQTGPFDDRINRLEAKATKIDAIESSGMAAAERAEAAATKAEQYLENVEAASKKATKAFELQLRK